MGSKAPDPPDYSELAAASNNAAEYSHQQAMRQQAFAEQQYQDMRPLFDQIVNDQMLTSESQRGAMDQQMVQAQDYYDYQKGVFRPMEERMAADAQSFNSDAYREELARQAKASAEIAFGNQEDARMRQNASMGINPNSGRMAAGSRHADLAQAAQTANQMNSTRSQAEQMGWARQLDATGLGRNLAGASQGAYSGAVNAGTASNSGLSAAGQNAMTPGNQYMSGMQSAASTGLAGTQTQVQGLSNVAGMQTDVWGQQADNAWSQQGSLIGGGIGLLSTGMQMSDVRLKTAIRLVGRYPNGFKQYEFGFRNDPAGRRYRGVLAQEVERTRPDAVTLVDGYKAVHYDRLDLAMEQVA